MQRERSARVRQGGAQKLSMEERRERERERMERLRRWESEARDEMERRWERDVLERARAHVSAGAGPTHSLSSAGKENVVYVDLQAQGRDEAEAGGVAAEASRQRNRETKTGGGTDAFDHHSLPRAPPRQRLGIVHTGNARGTLGEPAVRDGGGGSFEEERAATNVSDGGKEHSKLGSRGSGDGRGARLDSFGVGRAWEGAGDSDSTWSVRSHATPNTHPGTRACSHPMSNTRVLPFFRLIHA